MAANQTIPQATGRDASRQFPRLLKVPVTLDTDGSTPFRHGRQMLVPERPGIYLIHDLRGVLYVGRTENLYRRFGQHYWRPDNHLLSRAMKATFGQLNFSWMLAPDPLVRIQIETELISWLQPVCNRQIG